MKKIKKNIEIKINQYSNIENSPGASINNFNNINITVRRYRKRNTISPLTYTIMSLGGTVVLLVILFFSPSEGTVSRNSNQSSLQMENKLTENEIKFEGESTKEGVLLSYDSDINQLKISAGPIVEEGYFFVTRPNTVVLPAYWIPETKYLHPGKCKVKFNSSLIPIEKGEVWQWDMAYMDHKFAIYSLDNSSEIISCEHYVEIYSSDPVVQSKSKTFEEHMKNGYKQYFFVDNTKTYFLKCIHPSGVCDFTRPMYGSEIIIHKEKIQLEYEEEQKIRLKEIEKQEKRRKQSLQEDLEHNKAVEERRLKTVEDGLKRMRENFNN